MIPGRQLPDLRTGPRRVLQSKAAGDDTVETISSGDQRALRISLRYVHADGTCRGMVFIHQGGLAGLNSRSGNLRRQHNPMPRVVPGWPASTGDELTEQELGLGVEGVKAGSVADPIDVIGSDRFDDSGRSLGMETISSSRAACCSGFRASLAASPSTCGDRRDHYGDGAPCVGTRGVRRSSPPARYATTRGSSPREGEYNFALASTRTAEETRRQRSRPPRR